MRCTLGGIVPPPHLVTSPRFLSSLLHCRIATRECDSDGRTRLLGTAIRGAPRPPEGGGLPDAWLVKRGRRCRPGSLAPPRALRDQRHREPGQLDDDYSKIGRAHV